MNFHFLGGAEQVGSLGMYLETNGAKLLFDYGITPTNPPGYPLYAPKVDRAFLSHAHVDHSGMMPWLCGRRDALVHALPPTIDVALLLAEDSVKICGYNGYESPYDKHDIHQAEANYRPIRFGQTKAIGNVEVTPHPAGHIPGAAMYEVESDETLLFTGDIHTVDTGLTKRAKPVQCDTLVMESTYAGRTHEPREKVEYSFLEKVEEVLDRGGQVVIPAFAVGRTQEVLLLLRNSGYDIWIDGMGKTVTKMYLGFGEYLKNHQKLSKAKSQAKIVRHPRSRAAAKHAEVVITTSGMLDGGPVMHYLKHIADDEKSAVLLTGYQVEGTNGRRLVDEGKMDIDGDMRRLKCEVSSFDLSAHADHNQLIDFAKGCSPEKIVLMHGDQREILAEDLTEFDVYMPKNDERFTF